MAIKEKLKKCNPLVAVLVVVVISLITAISVLLVLRFLGGETKKRKVCETPECINLAHRLHNFADTSVDPCVDFFKFSCGKYNEHVKDAIGTISEKQNVVWNIIKAQVLKNTTSTHSGTVLRNAYQACLLIENEVTRGAAVLKNDKDLLEQINSIGSWPLITPHWDPTSFNLNDWLVKMATISAPEDFGLFQLTTFRVFMLSTSNRLQKAALEQQIVSLLNHNNIAFNKSRLSADLDQVFTFQQNMQGLIVPVNKNENLMNYEEVKKNVPTIDFDKVLYALASPPGTPDPPLKLNFDKITKKMIIIKFKYFAGTDDNIQKLIERTEPRVLANLLIFQHIANAKKPLAEISECIGWITTKLPQAALKIFVPYFDHENIQLVSEMVDELKISYVQMFKESEWLSESTRKTALKKVDKMTKWVGYPDGWKEGVEKSYEKLDIKLTDSILTIESKAAKFRTEQNIAYGIDESLFVPGDQHVDMNAYYMPIKNHLAINTAIMDDPMFDATFPIYAKLASNGQVLGHEIGHGFDSEGATFDENGMPNEWWAPTDKKTFGQKSKCFVDQYENYDDPVFGKKLNGTLTLAEMMADQLGTENLWRTYKRLYTSYEPDLFGFEGYSIDKLFFRINALNWCSNPTKDTLDQQLEDNHPVNSFRISGVVSNMRQFAEAYNCPAGSPMNPEKKCTIF